MDIMITVPLNEKALREAATRLGELADRLIITILEPIVVQPPAPVESIPITIVTPSTIAPPAPAPAAIASTIPPPPAPLAPPAQSIVPSGEDPIDLDTEGLPWDERICSSSKSKYAKDNTQAGTVTGGWKRRRGVQPLTIDEVKAELRITYPAPIASVTPVAPPTVPVASPGAPVAPVLPDGNLYLPLMTKCTARIHATELTLEDIVAVCQRHGVNTVPELAARPDLIPTVEAEIEAIWIRNTTTQG